MVDTDPSTGTATLLTDHNAPMHRLIRVPLCREPSLDKWVVLVNESSTARLDWAMPLHGDRLLLCYLENVQTALYVCAAQSGEVLCRLEEDSAARILCGVFCRKAEPDVFLAFESFTEPATVYRVDFSTSAPKHAPPEMHALQLGRNEMKVDNEFTTRQVFYPSRDGTSVPMYIVTRHDRPLDGSAPLLLNVYGGFGVAEMPSFSPAHLLFLRHFDGVVAVANVRGGGELGSDWHAGGMRAGKESTFDDVIAAAEYLIGGGYTSPRRLAIHGASHGALVVAVCSQRRPDLFGAVVNRVGYEAVSALVDGVLKI